MKKTAVEWLIEQLTYNFETEKDLKKIFRKAKEMEIKQIINAYKFGLKDEYVIGSNNYYNKNYGIETPNKDNQEI